MKPIEFSEQTKVLKKPFSMTDDECGTLPVWTNGRDCVSCWRPTLMERLSIAIFGKIWLTITTGSETQPPVGLDAGRTHFTVVINGA